MVGSCVIMRKHRFCPFSFEFVVTNSFGCYFFNSYIRDSSKDQKIQLTQHLSLSVLQYQYIVQSITELHSIQVTRISLFIHEYV